MKVLVLVKESRHLQRGFEIDGDRIDDRFIDRELNDWDSYALEAAVQLGEADDDVEVVAVTVGPFFAVTTVKRALAHGADRAIRVWDDALSEDGVDPRPTAALLAGVVEREEPDLVLAGAQSADVSHGATGVLVAESTGYNWIAVADELEVGEEAVTVERELEGGRIETSRAELPAVVSVQTGLNEPRYVSLRSVHRQGGEERITALGLDDLGLDPDDVETEVEVRSLEMPKQSVETTYLEGDTDDQAAELIEVLEAEGVLP